MFYRIEDPRRPRGDASALRWFDTEQAAREAGLRPVATRPGLEEFEILEELGRGGTATVFRARDRILGRDVAIKLIRPTHLEDQESLARFTREARLVARLQHPGIASVYGVRELPDGGLALLMEYVPGITLREVILREAPLPVARVEAILRDVGEALMAAHAQGIVHRDVKPQNIFVHATTGRAILADFGTAIPLHDTTRITHAGAVIGTPAYMSPEQFDDGDLDGRSDLYSLGLVGWEMLTGVSPWEGESLYNIIYKQKRVSLPSLRRLRRDTPPRIRYAIEGALAKDRDARWSGVDEFLSYLSGGTRGWWWRRWTADLFGRPVGGSVPDAVPVVAPDPLAAAAPAPPPDAPTVRFQPGDDPFAGMPPPADQEVAAVEPPTLPRQRSRRVPGLGWVGVTAVLFLGIIGAAIASEGLRQPAEQRQSPTEPRAAGSRGAAAPVAGPATPGVPDVRTESASDSLAPPLALAEPPDDSIPVSAVAPRDSTPPPAETALGIDEAPEEPGSAPSAEGSGIAEQPTEPAVLDVDRSRFALATGGIHSCTVASSGRVACWGGNDRGQLGSGGGARSTSPEPLELGDAQSVVAGGFHSCILDAWGQARCWGENREGQLGGGTLGLTTGGVAVLGQRFATLTLGIAHSCGIARGGGAFCWGSNAQGQLGTGGGAGSSRPLRVTGGHDFVRLTAGWNHTCGLTRQGRALCWGDNGRGQLGDGSTASRPLPTPVAGQFRFSSIAAGSAHTCGLTLRGEVLCWGRNGDGRLGDGGTADRSTPTRVRTSERFVQISAGGGHTCGVAGSGAAYCWGQNNYGQLGEGSTTARAVPVPVAGDLRFERVQAGGSHSCGLTTDGATYCWGYNLEGQLGDGTLAHRTEPQRVTTRAEEAG